MFLYDELSWLTHLQPEWQTMSNWRSHIYSVTYNSSVYNPLHKSFSIIHVYPQKSVVTWPFLHMCIQISKRHPKQSHSSWVGGSNLWKAVGSCIAQYKMLPFHTKTKACLKQEDEFGYLVTFWFSTFAMHYCAVRSLAGHESSWNFSIYCGSHHRYT